MQKPQTKNQKLKKQEPKITKAESLARALFLLCHLWFGKISFVFLLTK
jgi:hypothetical protein